MNRTLIAAALLLLGCGSDPTGPLNEPMDTNPAPDFDATTSGYLGGMSGASGPGSWGYRREGGYSNPATGIACTWQSTNRECISLLWALGLGVGGTIYACSKVPAAIASRSWAQIGPAGLGCSAAATGTAGVYSKWKEQPGNEIPKPVTPWSRP